MEQSKAIGEKVKQIHHSSCIQLCRLRYSSPLLIHKLFSEAYHPQKFLHARKLSEKNLNSDDHFGRSFAPYRNGNQTTKKKGKTMNPLTHFRKIRILPLLSLGAIFALLTTAHAQNLYVSAQVPPSHAILEFTPSGGTPPTTFASELSFPRGLAFDGLGNLFAANNPSPDNIVIGRVLKFDLRNHVSTFGSAANFFFEGLAMDMAGNAYVMATVNNSPTGAGTIFKFTPSGERIVFGSVPGAPNAQVANGGLAFDRAGYYLYAAASGAQTIYKFAPNGDRSVFVGGPSAFMPGENPFGLAFDSTGNLYVSIETFSIPGADSIVYFDSNGVRHLFANNLTTPRGLAFDSSGYLFVAEVYSPVSSQPGDILKFPPGGGQPIPFYSFSHGRPEFLTFGPPR